jgi:hypothetical protein
MMGYSVIRSFDYFLGFLEIVFGYDPLLSDRSDLSDSQLLFHVAQTGVEHALNPLHPRL